jgi:2-octaprenyl-6-methoxyphenol hydroxylase
MDVIIQGAGPVGLACAISLLKNNPELKLTLLDKNSASDPSPPEDHRGIAISEGSKQLLVELGAWSNQVPAIHQVHVSQRGHFGKTTMRRTELNQEALGHIVQYAKITELLRNSLKIQATKAPFFQWKFGHQLENSSHEITPEVHLENCCVIHADGGLFHQQVAKDTHKNYHQSALVGYLDVAGIEPNTAWERFTSEGPLALLPHQLGPQALNFVWCASPHRVTELQNLSEPIFLEELKKAFGLPIGQFLHVHRRQIYPLGLNIRQDIVKDQEVWIGNAAQTLHPVAGQGLNLGLRDAITLANCLSPVFARQPNHSTVISTLIKNALSQYAKERRSDRQMTIGITDLMANLFTSQFIPIVAARGLALATLQWLPPLKNALARQMMFGKR